MKKAFLSFLAICVLTVSVWGVISSSCESCVSGHQNVSKPCHTAEKTVKKSSCCSQKAQSSTNSCDMGNTNPSDCQICAHTDQPPAKIEASVNLKMDKKVALSVPEAQNAFSNQVPPPTISGAILTESPPIVANHLVFLESIRLLI